MRRSRAGERAGGGFVKGFFTDEQSQERDQRTLIGSSDVQLHCGDCLEVMKGMADGSVDAVVTDPPYGIGTPHRVTLADCKGKRRLVGHNFGVFDEGSVSPKGWLPAVVGVLNSSGVIVSFYNSLRADLLCGADVVGLEVVQDFHWCKSNPPVPMRSVGFSWGTESGYVFRRLGCKHRHNDGAGISPNWIIASAYERGRHVHPTQKPLSVVRWLVDHWSFPGQIIFDPFMGSGTTGVACIQTGRRFIGIEIDEGYFKIAQQRIANAIRKYGGRDGQ